LVAPPDDLDAINLQIARDEDVLGEYALPNLSEGTFSLTIPEGVAFAPPSEHLEIRVVKPDGTKTEAVTKQILTPEAQELEQAEEQTLLFRPVFESITPGWALRGDPAQTLQISGQNLSAVTQVFVAGVGGEWASYETTSSTDTTVQFRLPASMLFQEGFLRVSPFAGDQTASVTFLVADPTIPPTGTASGIILTSAEPEELEPGGPVTISGSGFVDGMAVVLGRNNRGVALSTTTISSGLIQAQLPEGYLGRANDLYVAVLASDGAELSATLPVESVMTEQAVQYGRFVPEGETIVTGVSGSVVWNGGPNQRIILEGVGLQPGMQVEITAGNRTYFATTTAEESFAASALASEGTTRVSFQLEEEVSRWPSYIVSLLPEGLRELFTGPPRRVDPVPPVFIRLGARVKLEAFYMDGDDSNLYIVPRPDPAGGHPTCEGQSFEPALDLAFYPWSRGKRLTKIDITQANFSVVQRTMENPFPPFTGRRPIPLLQREGNRCDPEQEEAFYLRALRWMEDDEKAWITAGAQDPRSQNPLRGRLDVVVLIPSLGDPGGGSELEADIIKVAGETGFPPQILKSQVEQESEFNPFKYRYEAISIDFGRIGGDGAAARANRANEIYYRRHMIPGSAILSERGDVQCKIFAYPGTNVPANESQGCDVVHSEAIELENQDVPILTREGHPPSTATGPTAVRTELPPDEIGPPWVLDLDRIDPPIWSRHAIPQPRARHHEPLDVNEFIFDPTDNSVTLGRPLVTNSWVKIHYRTVRTEEIVAGGELGECPQAHPLDIASLTGHAHPESLNFQPGDRIGSYLERNKNTPNLTGGLWLVPGTGEEYVEFVMNSGTRATTGVMDSRIAKATAQFLAAGSFGLLQMTLQEWFWGDEKTNFLNQLFDLREGQRCLQELRPSPPPDSNPPEVVRRINREALRLGVAVHAFNASVDRSVADYECSFHPCDQIDWQRRWALIINRYNSNGKGYTFSRRRDPRITVNGLNFIVERAIRDYDARWR
jgi:hypothetical protein